MSTSSLLLLFSIHIHTIYSITCNGDCACTSPAPCSLTCSGADHCHETSDNYDGYTFTCKPGYPCTINCITGDSVCEDAIFDGSSASNLTINCQDHQSCKRATVHCGSGDCIINCIDTVGEKQCDLMRINCGDSKSCKLRCGATASVPCRDIVVSLQNTKAYQCDGADCDVSNNVPPPFTALPTLYPTPSPTNNPTATPTSNPIPSTDDPTNDPTIEPTVDPTNGPTDDPTTEPSIYPTTEPSIYAISDPSIYPTLDPSVYPATNPTSDPSVYPTLDPSVDPTIDSLIYLTGDPSIYPTSDPTIIPTKAPSQRPTAVHQTNTIETVIVGAPTTTKQLTTSTTRNAASTAIKKQQVDTFNFNDSVSYIMMAIGVIVVILSCMCCCCIFIHFTLKKEKIMTDIQLNVHKMHAQRQLNISDRPNLNNSVVSTSTFSEANTNTKENTPASINSTNHNKRIDGNDHTIPQNQPAVIQNTNNAGIFEEDDFSSSTSSGSGEDTGSSSGSSSSSSSSSNSSSSGTEDGAMTEVTNTNNEGGFKDDTEYQYPQQTRQQLPHQMAPQMIPQQYLYRQQIPTQIPSQIAPQMSQQMHLQQLFQQQFDNNNDCIPRYVIDHDSKSNLSLATLPPDQPKKPDHEQQ